MQHLSKQQESFCENAGLFGILISAACLIQHMVLMLPHWITFAIAGVYILCIVSFVLLIKKQPVSAILLAVCSGLIFILEILMILSLTFSLVPVLLLIYSLVITVLLYMGGIAGLLKKRSLAIKEEENRWNNMLE